MKQEDPERSTILNHQTLITIICPLFHSSFIIEHMRSQYNKESVDQLIILSLHLIINTFVYPNAKLNNLSIFSTTYQIITNMALLKGIELIFCLGFYSPSLNFLFSFPLDIHLFHTDGFT